MTQASKANDDKMIQAMIEQKLKEISSGQITINEEEQNKLRVNIKEIGMKFEEIIKNQVIAKQEKDEAIKDAVFALAAMNQSLEEHQYLVKKYGIFYKQERETSKIDCFILFKGKQNIQRLGSFKQQLEQSCRELQSKNVEIFKGNQSMKDSYEKERENIIASCEKNIIEFEDKITQEEVENRKLETENLDLREQLKSIIQEHEEKSKIQEQERTDKDEKCNESQQKLKEDYTEIEQKAQEAIQIQKQNSQSFKTCQEMKVQIVYYKDKIQEFESSLEKSKEFLDVVVKEIGKVGIKLKPFCEKKKKLSEKANVGDSIIIQYLDKNAKQKEVISQLMQQKILQSNVCKKLQEELAQKQKQ